MINLDYFTLKGFFAENIDFFIGGRIQKIQQPSRKDFIFKIRNAGESKKFYININPEIFHLCFMNENNEKLRNIVIPKQPPMFCMLLRKYIEGCKIIDGRVIDNERILELYFEIIDETSELREIALCIELMGKHSNIILYDRKTSLIIGCAHNIGSEKSRYRELRGGEKYARPPKVNTMNKISEPLYKILGKKNYYVKNINELLDTYFAEVQSGKQLETEKIKIKNIVNNKLKKIKSSEENIKKVLSKRNNPAKYRLYGELLTANIYQNKNFQKEITVWDYINSQNITIKLDETKTLQENAQQYFKIYTKYKITQEKSEQLLQELTMQKQYLENVLYSIINADRDDLAEIQSEFGVVENKKTTGREVNILKEIIDDFEVYIGKNNKQNDYIVSKLLKDNDLWFHTKSCAGSHVLLKINQKEPDENIILECCKLARKYSSATQPSKIGVIFTKGKFIKKPPSAPLGYVTFTNEKEVLI